MKDTALLIIDVQNDYFPGGQMALPGADNAASRIQSVLKEFRKQKLPVIHIQHESVKKGSTFFLPGTQGQKIHNLVKPEEGEKVVAKHFPNSFLKTELHAYLGGLAIKRLVITGMMTFMCVDATTRAAKDMEYECVLVHDCTATPATEFGGTSCSAEQAQSVITCGLSHICDEVVSAEELLAQL